MVNEEYCFNLMVKQPLQSWKFLPVESKESSTLKNQSGSTDKTFPVVCQKNLEIGTAAKASSH